MLKITGHFSSVTGAVNAFTREINEFLAIEIKTLLEEKHLYQKVSIDPDSVAQEVMKHVVGDMSNSVQRDLNRIRRERLTPTSGTQLRLIPAGGGAERYEAVLPLPNVRLFCTPCGERTVFAPVWYQDSSNQLLGLSQRDSFQTNADILSNQLFFVAMQCQHCKGLPEGFLIRREGWKFSLDGRSPIEHIPLPQFIPRPESNLFRDALIGRFTGKNLAGAFYLRAFIEQFARRQTELKNVRRTGDEIMDAYAQTIPEAQRGMMPSLKEWYDKLSEPLHNADEHAAAAVFDDARTEIERHFDIRRALRIPEKA